MAITHDALMNYLRESVRIDTSKIGPETLLFSSGLIDSFSMVELVLFIEMSCGIKMKPSEVNLDNIDSIERIIAFAAARGNGSTEIR